MGFGPGESPDTRAWRTTLQALNDRMTWRRRGDRALDAHIWQLFEAGTESPDTLRTQTVRKSGHEVQKSSGHGGPDFGRLSAGLL